MAHDQLPHAVLQNLLTQIETMEEVDVLRKTAEWALQQLIEADVSQQIGAEPYERTDERSAQRNGSRVRPFNTRVGELALAIPKLREGSYYPDWCLERRKPAEKALVSAIAEAYVCGIGTRKMDRLVVELGLEGIDKSAVSRINKELDQRVKTFRERPLEGHYPYIWLDATFPKVREDGRVQSTALVVAIGVREDGHREILGLELGASETEAFWMEFLRGLAARGLTGVQLVISDAHQGLKNAVGAVLSGAAWQRCQVHFMRNILTHVPKSAQEDVANQVRTIFEQPSYETAEAQLLRVATELEKRCEKAAQLLLAAAPDLLAHMQFPKPHWKRIRSNNPLERLNREIHRRFDVVGIFPNRDAVIRLGGALLLEQHEEWLIGHRYFSEESMALLLKGESQGPDAANSTRAVKNAA